MTTDSRVENQHRALVLTTGTATKFCLSRSEIVHFYAFLILFEPRSELSEALTRSTAEEEDEDDHQSDAEV